MKIVNEFKESYKTKIQVNLVYQKEENMQMHSSA